MELRNRILRFLLGLSLALIGFVGNAEAGSATAAINNNESTQPEPEQKRTSSNAAKLSNTITNSSALLSPVDGADKSAEPEFPSEVKIPCEPDPDPTDLKNGVQSKDTCMLGLRSCSEVTEPILSRISNGNGDGYFDQKIKYYYKGVDVNIEETTNPAKPAGGPFDGPICNVAAGEMNKNHQGKSCGTKIHFTKSSATQKDGHGSLEKGYIRGAWIQALKHNLAGTVKSVRNSGAIQIKTEACKPLARDVRDLFNKTQRMSKRVEDDIFAELENLDPVTRTKQFRNFCGQPTIGASGEYQVKVPDLCYDKNKNPNVVEMNELDVKHRIASCYLQAARADLEDAFARLLNCEISFRADKHYADVIVGTKEGNFTNSIHETRLKKEVTAPCESKAVAKGKKVGKAKKSRSAGERAALSEWKSCYGGRYPAFFRGLIQDHFPDSLQFKETGT